MASHFEWKAIPKGKPLQRNACRKECHPEWEAILNEWHGLTCTGPSNPFNNTLRAILAQRDPFNNTLRAFLATTDSLTIPYGRLMKEICAHAWRDQKTKGRYLTSDSVPSDFLTTHRGRKPQEG
jgi:hypothetical protein